MDKFRCMLCKKIEQFVHVCEEKHLVCERCFDAMTKEDMTHLCSCGAELLAERQSNPLNALIEEKCPHLDCTWTVNSTDMSDHISECRYRPYKCLGATLKIWVCNWSGRQIDLPEHLATVHPELGAALPHNATNRITFDDTHTGGTLNLVNAFSRHFVFFYYKDIETRLVYFMVFLLGRRSTASRYYVEFQLNYNSTQHERVDFVTPCVSDCADIRALMAAEKCIVLTYSSVRKYVGEDGCLGFRLFVKEKNSKSKPNALSVDQTDATTLDAVKPKPAAALKPQVKRASVPNNTKKPGTSAAGAGGQSVGPLNSRVPSVQSQPGKSTAGFLSASQPPATSAPSTFKGPIPTNSSNSNCKYSAIYRQQPYKAVDEKFYTLKYPSSSIQKPVYKK